MCSAVCGERRACRVCGSSSNPIERQLMWRAGSRPFCRKWRYVTGEGELPGNLCSSLALFQVSCLCACLPALMHAHLTPCLFVYQSLSICLSTNHCPFVCLPISVHLSVYQSLSVLSVFQSVHLSVFQSLFICQSTRHCPFVCLLVSVYLSL